jgi:hypothetical protein
MASEFGQACTKLESDEGACQCVAYARCSEVAQAGPKLPDRPFHGGNEGSNPSGDAISFWFLTSALAVQERLT